MFYVLRVRLKPNREVEQCDTDLIVPPDMEMWAVYKRGKTIDEYEGLYTTIERANAICEEKIRTAEIIKSKNNGPA